ncbi:benzoate/H(+) symporter BenE family transporter [Micromonospora sp. WMMD812]|uniref:benzoate/H(+) symporter BenE family transporter n=1 Tax=Micromonospora sp. WMMD812 TaxID=3015152 RepID=UPI00248C5878|nr:benzoate/H(+) symporter BenE family transporter [Micromonospora sp. WMMD812]WBB65523.1 benzoate/H(+) symporter BenE family transporter [Micromonospora sp. WMMD812]
MAGRIQPVLAGVVTALVGFASSFTVVLAGLRAAGADAGQAASGLLALCVASGLAAAWLGLRHRLPMSVAWSTPGAALLVATGPVPGGWPAAVGAFVVSGLLIVAAGLVPALGRAVAAIPKPVAGAMLAGVLLPLCTAPVRALVEVPRLAGPVVVAWLLLHRYARRWAVPGALVVAVVAIAWTSTGAGLGAIGLRPVVELTPPAWDAAALVGVALPLFLVTMAAQNVPGMAVLVGYGYRPPFSAALRTTGLLSVLAAPAGGHAVNLAAITAALAAGPDAHPDPDRRWIASVTAGAGLALLGLGAGAATALVATAPPILIEAVAGLALLGALATALASAVAEPAGREAAVVTFVVTASGVTLVGVGGAFWGLVAGCLMLLLFRRRRRPAEPAPAAGPASATGPASVAEPAPVPEPALAGGPGLTGRPALASRPAAASEPAPTAAATSAPGHDGGPGRPGRRSQAD